MKRRKRSEMIEKIPVLTVSGATRNRNLIKLLHQAEALIFPPRLTSPISRLKLDLEERARNSGLRSGRDLKVETLYVDTTRNVGVVLGSFTVQTLW